jgi:hypothetical protein
MAATFDQAMAIERRVTVLIAGYRYAGAEAFRGFWRTPVGLLAFEANDTSVRGRDGLR